MNSYGTHRKGAMPSVYVVAPMADAGKTGRRKDPTFSRNQNLTQPNERKVRAREQDWIWEERSPPRGKRNGRAQAAARGSPGGCRGLAGRQAEEEDTEVRGYGGAPSATARSSIRLASAAGP